MRRTCDLDWGLQFEQHGLGLEDLAGLDADAADFGLLELDIFAGGLPQLVDDEINVQFLVCAAVHVS